MKKIIIITVTLLIALLIGYKLYNNKKYLDEKATPQKLIINTSVETIKAQKQNFKDKFNYTGTFNASKEVNVLSETNGKVVKLNVREGDFVSAGSVLAQVDKEILNAQLYIAEAQLEKLQKDLQRMENLAKANAATDIQLQDVKLGVKSSEANFRILKKQLSNTSIIAPISGVITKKMIEDGSVLSPGVTTFVITDVANVKLLVMVSEKEIVKIVKNMKVNVSLDAYSNIEFAGNVSLVPVKSNQSQLFPVEITVNNSKKEMIRAGMFGRVNFTEESSRNSIAIPRLALIGSIKNPQVFVIKDNIAYLKSIVVNESESETLEVISGLKENDEVVINGQINLTNKVAVTVVNNNN